MGQGDYRQGQGRQRPIYKSRGEQQIGEFLSQNRIPFIYEKPTAVMDRGLLRLNYPDFSLQYGPLIEYFGINGDQHYIEQARHKLKVYRENQYDVIPVYPPDMCNGWQDGLLERIGWTLERRLMDFRNGQRQDEKVPLRTRHDFDSSSTSSGD
jgi:hypothetical protein